ncbi:UNVERIFIED_CONTAM: hypothetical protein GTU68_058665 [Idotea baltica]|nr:hypothetical protein [Idotea baltica]
MEPDYAYSFSVSPNDPFFSDQWGLNNNGQEAGSPGADISAQEAWDIETGRRKIVAGVIDTGIDYGHEDLNDLVGWDFINNDNDPFDDNGHGTHVSGIIAARGNNGIGIAGVAWSAKLMALKAFDNKGSGSLSTILPALEYARKMGVDLTNNSWGGTAYSEFLEEEIQAADSTQQLFVAAAGNENIELGKKPIYPASYSIKNIIAVGATDQKDQPAEFSNYDVEMVDLFAPGKNILSTLPNNQYGKKSGTSMAAPFVSGAICLMKSHDKKFFYMDIKGKLLSNTDKKSSLNNMAVSHGRLNIFSSLQAATPIADCSAWTNLTSTMSIYTIVEQANSIWIGTSEGLGKFQKNSCSYKLYNMQEDSLAFAEVKSLVIDKDGNKWMSYDGYGILRFDGDWKSFTNINSSFPQEKVLSLSIDDQGIIWAGTEKGTLLNYDGSNWQIVAEKKLLIGYINIYSIDFDSQGNVWLGTSTGLYKYENNQLERYAYGFFGDYIKKIAIDFQDNIWCATEIGIGKFDQTKWKFYNKWNSDVPNNSANAIFKDKRGNIWMGTDKGMVVFNGKKWIVLKTDNSDLPADYIKAMDALTGDHIWVGTSAGIQAIPISTYSKFSIGSTQCLNTPIEVINESIGAESYQWFVNDVESAITSDFSVILETPGKHTLSLVTSNHFDSDTLTFRIQISDLPELDLGPDTSYCAEAIKLDAGVDKVAYSWTNELGHVLDTTQTLTVKESGTYILTITDQCGRMDSDSISINLTQGCVWPGDVNADGVVTTLDFLSLGTAVPLNGPARPGTNTTWEAQTSTDWPTQFPESHNLAGSVNHKHADCDGDGIIDLTKDGSIIKMHAGLSRQSTLSSEKSDLAIRLEPIDYIITNEGTIKLTYDIILENMKGGLVENIYGIAFSMTYNHPVRDVPTLNTTDSWLGATENIVVHNTNQNGTSSVDPQLSYAPKNTDYGMARRSGGSSSGSGRMASSDVIITMDDITEDPSTTGYVSFSVSLSNIILIDQEGSTIPLNSISGRSLVTTQIPMKELENTMGNTGIYSDDISSNLQVYPNPAQNQFQVIFTAQEEENITYSLKTMLGKTIASESVATQLGTNYISQEIGNLPSGIYFIQIENQQERFIHKLKIVR